jgi:hypothetical protein
MQTRRDTYDHDMHRFDVIFPLTPVGPHLSITQLVRPSLSHAYVSDPALSILTQSNLTNIGMKEG